MSKLFSFSGINDLCYGEPVYSKPKEAGLPLSIGHQFDMYFPPSKRSRIGAPFIFNCDRLQKQKQVSINVLPDECLFEVLRRLSGDKERSACASVSKRWLMLLCNISRDERHNNIITQSLEDKEKNGAAIFNGTEAASDVQDMNIEGYGYLSRSLEGKKATDIRLASMSIGTANRGGLGKLSIRGSYCSLGVTNLGLTAIGRCCPSLRVLSLWNLPSIGDEGLSAIADGCHFLEKLDLCQCPAITNESLLAVGRNCPNLTDLTLECCSNIGNEGLKAIGQYCTKLKSISIRDCPLIGDQGIASLLSSTSFSLTKVKLQSLNVTDVSLAVVGHYGRSVTDLVLTSLQSVTEKGFWVMGNGHGLQKLKSLTIGSCQGVTDIGIEAMGLGCPNLKQLYLHKCAFLSDNGLLSFAKAAGSLETLQLEECHSISQYGFFGVLVKTNLKSLALINCFGIKDFNLGLTMPIQCKTLRSLKVFDCPGFGNASMVLLGKMCPQLQQVDFGGLKGITDDGFLPLIKNCGSGLVNVSLAGCLNLSDKIVSTISELHGYSLEVLNIGGCKKITDASMMAIAKNCPFIRDLDVSKCSITDSGVASLAHVKKLNLQILSVSGCSFISDKCLPFLKKLSRTLLGLNLKHCTRIGSSTVDILVEQLWRCDILS